MLVDQLLHHGVVAHTGLLRQIHQPTVEQKPALAGVAQHLHARVLRGQGHAGEIDVGGEVFQPHIGQRLGVAAVGAVAHQRAHVALRVVVLGLGEAVVQKKRRATLQTVGQGFDEGLGLRVDFGQVVVFAIDVNRRAQRGGAVGPHQLARSVACHAAFQPIAVHPRQQLHRHGVQHLVAQHHAAHALGQGVGPMHHVGVGGQGGALALAQAAREVNDGVAPGRLALGGQRVQHLQGQRAAARAKLPHLVGAGGAQGLGQLPRQRLAKQGRELGRGHKVAALPVHASGHLAKFGALVGVVA